MMLDTIIAGCGPYGLSASAYLRAFGAQTKIFGEPMDFWRHHAPKGMLLRSTLRASEIGAPDPALSLQSYLEQNGIAPQIPFPAESFIAYGRWFQNKVAPDLDSRRISRIARRDNHFEVTTEDGERFSTPRVVVAVGLAGAAHRPRAFRSAPQSLVSHSNDPLDFKHMAGWRVAVVGGGQSAVETAALLNEHGADVELIIRGTAIRWLPNRVALRSRLGTIGELIHPWTDVGSPPLSQVVARPAMYRQLPASLRTSIDRLTMRASVAGWLKQRIRDVKVTLSREVHALETRRSSLRLRLNDGSSREVQHVVLATGYKIDIARLTFLTPELLASIKCTAGYPHLNHGYESSVPGLHFIGAAAAYCFGPIVRFVAGTNHAASALASAICPRRQIAGRTNSHREVSLY